MSNYGIKFDFSVDGEKQIQRFFQIYGKKMDSFKWAFEKMAVDFYETEKKIFDAEGAYEGNPKWKDLSKGYGKTKEQEYPGKKILERTGAMRKSLTMRNDKYARCKITDKNFEIGSELKTPDKKYNLWMLHQRGWKKPEIRPKNASMLSWVGPNGQVFVTHSRAVEVPKRQPIKITKPQANRWMKILYTYVMGVATGRRHK